MPDPPEIPEPSQPPAEFTFWSWLSGWFTASSALDSEVRRNQAQLNQLRDSVAVKNRWRELVSMLLAPFDPDSSYRLGFASGSHDPDWLVLEGVVPDGSHLLITAEGSEVLFSFHYPNGWPRRRQSANPLPPPGWTCQVTEGPPWQITFQSGSEAWKDPDQLKALLESVLHSRLQSQSEEVLPCPNCSQPMQKQVLDVVLDRCDACHGLWFDYAEFEWLMKKDPSRGLLAAPAGANCPRCRVPLREGSRARKPAAECPQCRGTWFLLRPPPRSPCDLRRA